jgi:hypothetical protein
VRLEMPFEEALTHLNLGRIDRDEERLRRARDMFEGMGTRHFVDVADKELHR